MRYAYPSPPVFFHLNDHSEAALVHTWLQFRPGTRLTDTEGNPLLIVATGRRNPYDGPDIRGATVFYRNQIISGDIECHVKAQSWYSHGHHRDPAYATVILHLVGSRLTEPFPPLPHIILASNPGMVPDPLPTLQQLQAAGRARWQQRVATYRNLPDAVMRSRVITDSIPLFATKGNAAGFRHIYRHLDLDGFARLEQGEQKITWEKIISRAHLSWKTAGIRPAARAPRRLPLWARFITLVMTQKTIDPLTVGRLRETIRQGFPTDLATELWGNILLPWEGALWLQQGQVTQYARTGEIWARLRLSRPYGKVLRRFGTFLSPDELRRFSVLQGCLTYLADHA